MSLNRLPYEVVSIVTESLGLEDIFHLALSCQHLHYLIHDDRRCKVFLDTLAPATTEAQEALTTHNHARAFRRLIKRRQAIRSAAPFTAAIVAAAESWLYNAGVLCYIQERTLRVLDLHGSASTETVVDVRGLLCLAMSGEVRQRQRYKLQLLHYAAGLVTCLYTRARESWLLVVNAHNGHLVTRSPALDSTYKIFVRNDDKFLYFGTHSEFGDDGFRRWVLMSYDIGGDMWLDQKIHLMDLVGCDIGQSICFEIINGKFYGLSNQTKFEVDEADWTSYYHCFRFPVNSPRPKDTERSDRKRMWRRQHDEGPIDDRWSFLKLAENEDTGQLQILESRKEWLNGSSSGQRTYYTTDVYFQAPKVEEEEEEDIAGGPITPTTNASFTSNDSGYDSSIGNSHAPDSGHATHIPRDRSNYMLPTTSTPRLRDPHKTHIGDDASKALLFTFSKCPVRSYHGPSQTFLDLVDNPAPSDTTSSTRLRLRAGARQLMPTSALEAEDNSALPHTERIRRLYKNEGANKITFWPPEPREGADKLQLEQLGRIINPPSHAGNVIGAWDERSFVYSVGSNADGVQAVVFIGFDPAIELRGLQTWGEQQQPVEEHYASTAAPLSNAEGELLQKTCHGGLLSPTAGEQEEICELDSADKGKEVVSTPGDDFGATWATASSTDTDSPQGTIGYSSGEDEPLDAAVLGAFPSLEDSNIQQQQLSQQCESGAWAWTQQPAMYKEKNFGFNRLPDFTQDKRRVAASVAASDAQ